MAQKSQQEARWLLLKQAITLSGVSIVSAKQWVKLPEADKFKRTLPGGKRILYTKGVVKWLQEKRDEGLKQRWITRRKNMRAKKLAARQRHLLINKNKITDPKILGDK